MGFLKSCLEQLIRLAALSPFNPFEDVIQQPILGSEDIAQHPLIPSVDDTTIIEPELASPGFQCVYPSRWKSCNTAETRDCWLQDTQSDEFSGYSQIDINTNCKCPFTAFLNHSSYIFHRRESQCRSNRHYSGILP